MYNNTNYQVECLRNFWILIALRKHIIVDFLTNTHTHTQNIYIYIYSHVFNRENN